MTARAWSGPSAFLNVPFDRGYEAQFIALMAAIIAIGRTPRCVLEIAEVGAGRLSRILGLIIATPGVRTDFPDHPDLGEITNEVRHLVGAERSSACNSTTAWIRIAERPAQAQNEWLCR